MAPKKLIYGVGVNDVDIPTREMIDVYQRWHTLIKRCYSKKYQDRFPCYQGCIVCDEWHKLSNFKAWMESQDWEEKELDKDLFGTGKLYSPEMCAFIPPWVNTFLNTHQIVDRDRVRINFGRVNQDTSALVLHLKKAYLEFRKDEMSESVFLKLMEKLDSVSA